MSEARLLWLVLRYPHPTALARKAQGGTVFSGLRLLERRGLITRRSGNYRLTRRGGAALAMTWSLARLVARTEAPKGIDLVCRPLFEGPDKAG